VGGGERRIRPGSVNSAVFTGRALLHTLCGGDPARFKAMEGRFSKPVMPGDELTISMWVDGKQCLRLVWRRPRTKSSDFPRGSAKND
jgi:acyl dehydratase